MTGFRKSLAISAALHAGLLAATLVVLRAPPAMRTDAIDHVPLELVEDVSNDAQRAGEQRAERTEQPRERLTPQPSPRPDPTPVEPPERPRPVEQSSAPAPPPPAAERPVEQPQPPVPLPPQRPPPQEQQVARAEEPPDDEGLQRRIEAERQREREQQQRETREREQREARERETRERRERQQREARERRERQQREARERREREQQEQFNAQSIRDLLNRQEGTPQPQGRQGPAQTASLGNPRGRGQRLTQSQLALLAGMIRDQIAPCWSPPPGPVGGNRAVVRIELVMNRDGSLNARPRVMNASGEAGFRPLADSAVRAIERCTQRQGGRLNLPAEMYDVPNGWREIEFAFDPSQMS